MPLRYFISIILSLVVMETQAQNVPDMGATGPAGSAAIITAPPDLSPTAAPSWSKTYAPKLPETNANNINSSSSPQSVKTITVYSDGFNQPVQSVQHNAVSGAKPHLVTLYDTRFQQERRDFLPYPAVDPDYHNNMFAFQQYYYTATAYPGEQYTAYGLSKNLSNAQQRATKTMVPGLSQVGQNRGITVKRITNQAGEIKIWSPDANGKPVYAGTYAPGMLSGEQVYDTMGSLSTIYKDRYGRIICKTEKQVDQTSGGLVITKYGTTYYVYDVMGRMVCTMPPRASAASTTSVPTDVFANLCFQYQYDDKGRLVGQHFPGQTGFVEAVYDRQDRVVMRRRPNEKSADQWEVTFYDRQGRTKATSLLLANAKSRDSWQSLLDGGSGSNNPSDLIYYFLNPEGQNTYPGENSILNNKMMTYAYYDDYSITDPANTNWNNCITKLSFSEVLQQPGADTPTRAAHQRGLCTGTRVRIIPALDADTAQTGDWRVVVNYFDKKGRNIFNISQDLYHGVPVHVHYNANQYDFGDKLILTKHVMENSNGNTTQHKELTRNEYDPVTDRFAKSWHKTDTSLWVLQTTATYDALGRNQRKILGNYGEVQDYSYDIRGHLTGINALYAKTGDRQGESRSFGQSLSYDYGFTQPRYDGKLSGMLWRGAGSSLASAYGYSYDYSGRLTNAEYRRYEPPSGTFLSAAWRKDLADYTVSNLQYDQDGNIKNMQQRAVAPGGTVVTMDDLKYFYTANSNQVSRISEAAGFYDLGDFDNSNNTSLNDAYSYDPNGNLVADANKGITAVTYTYFNKPQTVTFLGGQTIAYSYDAGGNKVQELDNDGNGGTKQIDYIGNYVYENNDLQYATTEQGRSVYNNNLHRFTEEYFVKDNLDNVRSVVEVYTPPIQEYLATYEIASANIEGLFFEHHNQIRDDKPGGVPGDNKAGILNGANPNRRIGTSTLLHVMAGDKVEMNVNNFYGSYDKDNDAPVSAEDMLSTIITTLRGGAGGWQGSETHNVKTVTDVFNNNNYGVFEQLLNSNTDNTKPKAYLNYILFDENMHIYPGMSGSFQANGEGTWTQIGTSVPLELPVNGYLAVYLSNASTNIAVYDNGNVYFDLLTLRLTRGKLKEEAHYYPFGLPINGMGSTTDNYMENRRKYQSNEYITNLGLNWMDFNNRQYDPQTGRFLGVDPMADAKGQEIRSPYAAMGNDPGNTIDPDGLMIVLREVVYKNKDYKTESAIYENGMLYNMDHTLYTGNNQWLLDRANELRQLESNDPRFKQVINDLENHKLNGNDVVHIITNMINRPTYEWYNIHGEFETKIGPGSQLQTMKDPYLNIVKFAPENDRMLRAAKDFSNLQTLIHELKHDWNDSYGGGLSDKQYIPPANGIGRLNCEEVDGVNFQNIQRKIEGLSPRIKHTGAEVPENEKVAPENYRLRKLIR